MASPLAPLRLAPLLLLALAASGAAPVAEAPDPDTALVYAHVAAEINNTFREAQGQLPFPYQVPAGPYDSEWDWDSVFLGVVSSRDFNGSRYFVGSMSNFLAKTNLTTGEVKGCLTPDGDSPTLFHAKPIIIQGAFLAAKFDGGNYSQFIAFKPAMEALLAYWSSPQRVDAATGLHVWHDQLETGADNLVLSLCPSPYSPECWSESRDAFTLSAPDVELFVAREHLAFALFLEAWAGEGWRAEAAAHRARARAAADTVDRLMWVWKDGAADGAAAGGYYGGYNVSSSAQATITNRTYQMAWPLWDGGTDNETLVAMAAAELQAPDMWTPFGVRSVSSADPRYNNDNIINPYSNWRGPVWINVNAVLAFSLRARGFAAAAAALAANVVHTLAQDLRATGTWHVSPSRRRRRALGRPAPRPSPPLTTRTRNRNRNRNRNTPRTRTRLRAAGGLPQRDGRRAGRPGLPLVGHARRDARARRGRGLRPLRARVLKGH